MNCVIIRYDEIGLKGHNRPYFEKLLADNMRACLKQAAIPFEKVSRFRGRMVVMTAEPDKAAVALQTVFGIASMSPATRIRLDFEALKATALEVCKLDSTMTFRITAKRMSKKFAMDSRQLNEELGEYIMNQTLAKVDLFKPSVSIGVDVLEDSMLVFTSSLNGARGLPVGCEGKALGLFTMSRNSLAASWLMLKRGCKLVLLALIKPGEKDLLKKVISELERHSTGAHIRVYCAESFTYSMLQTVKDDEKCLALFDFTKTDVAKPQTVFVFRPLDGFNEDELVQISKRFSISLPTQVPFTEDKHADMTVLQ